MSNDFQALVLNQQDGKTTAAVQPLTQQDLPEGDVLVQVEYSSINYKDAMAVTGTGKIIRQFPMVPGIDSAGTVIESSNPRFKAGDAVVLTGWGVGERHWGGLAQRQRVKADWLVPLPKGISPLTAMTMGTAGLTAMLCVMALQDAGVASGPVLVYSTATPESVQAVQSQLGVEAAGHQVEQALAAIARGLVELGVQQMVVAGGETSGACVQALAIVQLQIGPQIDPGVPWCHAHTPMGGVHITLKSGNFGTDDFFTKAFSFLLQQP